MKNSRDKRSALEGRRKLAASLVLCVVTILLLCACYFGWQAWHYPDRPGPQDGPEQEVKVSIGKGLSLSQIVEILAGKHLITHPQWFRFYASEKGEASKIKAGEYSLSAKMTPREILDRLQKGPIIVEKAVVFPEGLQMLDIASKLGEEGICPKEEAERLMRDQQFIESLDIKSDTLEGYLYPDKYQFRMGTDCKIPLTRMVKQGRKVFSDLKTQYFEGLRILNRQYKFNDRDIIIMASLVEKETAQKEERPRIAGVFLNRLRLPTFVPHRLETDPTIVYGCTVPLQKSEACKKFDGRIHRLQLQDAENPYNTYQHDGLPPGPIANPGRAALLAVFNPENTPYLYFVSKNDGTHQFSVTLEEHQAAVNKYQKHK